MVQGEAVETEEVDSDPFLPPLQDLTDSAMIGFLKINFDAPEMLILPCLR